MVYNLKYISLNYLIDSCVRLYSENRVLRRVFGPKRDEVTGVWRKLHNEELPDLYSSPTLARMIKSRTVGWAGHVAQMGEGRGVYSVQDNIKMDLQELRRGVWTGMSWLRIETGGWHL
jgi:hypothetical protein